MSRKFNDISETNYAQEMAVKVSKYKSLVTQAEVCSRDNDGKPTKEEAKLYLEAAQVCEEIMSRNLSQRNVHAQWLERKQFCRGEAKRIIDVLNPPPPVEPEEPQKDGSGKRDAKPGAGAGSKLSDPKPGTPQTFDGVTSVHSTKDIPIDMIASWFKNNKIPENGFEAAAGRTELKERLLSEAGDLGWYEVDAFLGLDPVHCYCLYGPPGSGKTFIINAFAGELKKLYLEEDPDCEFSYMQLEGSQIRGKYVGEAEKIVKAAFEVAMEHEPCLLFMDEIDSLCVDRGRAERNHERNLTVAFLEALNSFKKSGKRVVFMGATNFPNGLDEALLDRMDAFIKVPLPGEEDRKAYFERAFGNTAPAEADKVKESGKPCIHLAPDFSEEDMVDATDNCSFRDLDKLTDCIRLKLKEKAIAENRVIDESGRLNKRATSLAGVAALREGRVSITRDMFEQALKESPPSDKTKSRQALMEFEGHMADRE